MRDEGTEIFVREAVVEIDANDIAKIIADACGVDEGIACDAANLILDHLIAVHRHATRKQ